MLTDKDGKLVLDSNQVDGWHQLLHCEIRHVLNIVEILKRALDQLGERVGPYEL